MADTAALVVALSAQVTKFEKDMQKAQQIAAQGAKRIEDSFKININPFEKLQGALAAAGILEATRAVTELIKQIDDLGDQAEIVGLTTDKFQELRFAIIQSGQSADAANGFMERFSRALSEAQAGSGEFGKILKANNVDIKALTVESGLNVFADLIRNAKTQQDALNLAMTVGGRQAGPALVQALQGGSAGLKAAAEEAHRLGLVLSEELIKKGQELQRQYATMTLAVQSAFQTMAVSVGESVETTGKSISDLTSDFKKFVDDPSFEKFVTFLAGPRSGSLRSLFGTKGPQGSEFGFDPGKGGGIIGPSLPPGFKPPAGTTNLAPSAQSIAFQKAFDAQEKRIQMLNAEQKAIGLGAGAEAEYRTQVELTAAAKENDINLTQKVIDDINRQAAAVGAAAAALDEARRKFQGLQAASQFAGDQLIDVIENLTQKTQTFGETMQSVLRAVTHELLQAAITGKGAFAQLLGTASNVQGGTGGLLGQLINSIPKFASGGMTPGGLAVVGERGPEIVALPRGTQVIPNATAKGMTRGGPTNLNVSVDVTGANGDKAIEAAVNRGVARAVQQSVSIVNSTSPARGLRYSQLGT